MCVFFIHYFLIWIKQKNKITKNKATNSNSWFTDLTHFFFLSMVCGSDTHMLKYWTKSTSDWHSLLRLTWAEKRSISQLADLSCIVHTFHSSDEVGTVSWWISTCLHTGSSTRLVVPFTVIRSIIVVTENSCDRQNKYFTHLQKSIMSIKCYFFFLIQYN